ncbi:MAG: glyoxalase superfamily protein [Pseudomonadota bacterium]
MVYLPPIDDLKSQAKRLRADLAASGQTIGHSKSLELVAHQHGFRNWNTLFAKAGNRPPLPMFVPGQRISGRYLGVAFDGEVIAVATQNDGNRLRVTVRFDEPVNVSKFESMDVLRHRVTATIGRDGRTTEKTSDGTPHMAIDIG